MTSRLWRKALIIVLGMHCAHGLAAVDEAERPLEEVVVSGYRIKPVREADVSVSVIDERAMQWAAVAHFEEVLPLVPNLNLSGEGSRARFLQMRGIGEREQYEGAPNPSVGFIIDDIDLSGIGGIAGLFDIERAEILRGPQSARFGSSALAGIVYLRSAEPTEDFTARAEMTVGNEGLWSAGATLGGPLGESSAARVSVFRHASDGFRHNAWLDSATNERDELTARGKLAWSFGDGWQALLTGLYADFDNGYDAWTVENDDITHSDHPGQDAQETAAASLRVEGPLGDGIRLVGITGVASSEILFSFDGDWGNEEFWRRYGEYRYDYRYVNPRDRDTLSQELRLVSTPGVRLFGGRTDWVLGVYWQRLEEGNRIHSTGVYDDRDEENFCAPCLTDRRIRSDYEADTLAVFATTETRLAERWSLSAGLRFEHWSAEYADRWQDINFPEPPGGTSCSRFDCSPDEGLWGGHLAVSHDWDERRRAYLRIARGFKAGGFNPSLAALQAVAVLGPEFIPYDDESLWNYELGLKGRGLNDRFDYELSLFYMDREDAQLSQSSQQVPFDPNSFVFVTYNGDARVKGLEATFRWQLDGVWRLHGSLGLLQTEIDDTPETRAVSPDAVHRDLAHAPDYTLNLGATFTTPDGWYGRLDINAMDAFYFDISHNQRSERYRTVNLRLGRSWDNWSVAVWAHNLFDEEYFTRGFYFGNEPPAFPPTLYTRFGDPRSAGLTLQYRF